VRGFLAKLLDRARDLWRRALAERASPAQIGCAVGVGAFSACSPAIGVHGLVAIALATLLRLNRLWAFIGSRISPFFLTPWIVLAEVQAGHFVRSGTLLALARDEIVGRAGELLVDWIVGWFIVGGVVSFMLGFAGYLVAKRRVRGVGGIP
jgi:uncharacterized protein (DUF2062 family)